MAGAGGSSTQPAAPSCWTERASSTGRMAHDESIGAVDRCAHQRFATLAAAQTACARLPACDGITRDAGLPCDAFLNLGSTLSDHGMPRCLIGRWPTRSEGPQMVYQHLTPATEPQYTRPKFEWDWKQWIVVETAAGGGGGGGGGRSGGGGGDLHHQHQHRRALQPSTNRTAGAMAPLGAMKPLAAAGAARGGARAASRRRPGQLVRLAGAAQRSTP